MSIQGYALESAHDPPEPVWGAVMPVQELCFRCWDPCAPHMAVVRSRAFVLHFRDLGTEKVSPRLPFSCPHTSTGITFSMHPENMPRPSL